jgi:hypothetical protein
MVTKVELKVSSLGAWTAYVDGEEFKVKGIWLDSRELLELVIKSLGINVSYGSSK